MKERKDNLLPMNIQFFAEDGAGGASGAGDDAGAAGDGGNGADPEEKTVSFDDFLKTGDNQAEFDRRVDKAIKTAVSNAQKKWQTATDEKLSEAEKLAKMTKDEKAEYQRNKKEQELNEREAKIVRMELEATAKGTLVEKGLSADLYSLLNYSDADACNKSIEALDKAFKAAVAAGVQESLKGGNPMKKAPHTDPDADMEKEVRAALAGHI